MVDLERIAGFDWDAANWAKSIDKHEVTSIEAEQVFTNEPLLVVADPQAHRHATRPGHSVKPDRLPHDLELVMLFPTPHRAQPRML
ncbi:MAG: hypothetical protein ACREXW_19655 [Gammaproteobacteria bacterium]